MRRLGILLFCAIIIYFIFFIRQDIIDNSNLRREGENFAGNIEKEEKLTRELGTRSKELLDDNYIEKIARTKLGMIKKGETAYKVIRR